MIRILATWGFAALVTNAFGLWVGYHIFSSRDNLQAHIYGSTTVFMFGYLFGHGAVAPIAQKVWDVVEDQINMLWRQWKSSKNMVPALPLAEVETMFDRKTATLSYEGTIDRKYPIDKRNDPGTDYERVKLKFEMTRSLMAMLPREREAARILYVLYHENVLNVAETDKLKFAIIFGDGKARITSSDIKISNQLRKQYSIYSAVDFVNLEAKFRIASQEAAISELYDKLHTFRDRSPALAALYARVMGGDLNNPDDIPGSPETTDGSYIY